MQREQTREYDEEIIAFVGANVPIVKRELVNNLKIKISNKTKQKEASVERNLYNRIKALIGSKLYEEEGYLTLSPPKIPQEQKPWKKIYNDIKKEKDFHALNVYFKKAENFVRKLETEGDYLYILNDVKLLLKYKKYSLFLKDILLITSCAYKKINEKQKETIGGVAKEICICIINYKDFLSNLDLNKNMLYLISEFPDEMFISYFEDIIVDLNPEDYRHLQDPLLYSISAFHEEHIPVYDQLIAKLKSTKNSLVKKRIEDLLTQIV